MATPREAMDAAVTITCVYSCAACGIVKARVPVTARSPQEDVKAWLEGVCLSAVMADHRQRSPHCHPKELAELYIPISGAERIGGPCVS